jgi:HEAT repeat protein
MVKLIVQWTHHESPAVCSQGKKLWNVLGPQDIPAITVVVRSQDLSDRLTALEKLSNLGPVAMPTLIEMRKDKGSDADIHHAILESLNEIGPTSKDAAAAIAEVLHDKDWEMRSAAAIALGRIGSDTKPAVTALAAALADSDVGVAVCAMEALGRIGPEAQPATAGLIERLRDDRAPVRSAAARALGQIGPGAKAAVPALEKRRRDPADYVRHAAGEALAAIASTPGVTRP